MNENLRSTIYRVSEKVIAQIKELDRQAGLFSEPFYEEWKKPEEEPTKESIAKYIDHTLLKPEATEQHILSLCDEAITYQFASVCVNPYWVSLCSKKLEETDVLVCTVAGFPLGANTTFIKADESSRAVGEGADEVDMVLNIGKLKSGNYPEVFKDIRTVVRAAGDVLVKVIIETCLLTEEEKIAACILAKEAGAKFVKTSTGFNKAGATVEDVALMRQVVGTKMGVKAAGGIRDYRTAVAMIMAGANRIGASASVNIVS